jgi:hypothetical protein
MFVVGGFNIVANVPDLNIDEGRTKIESFSKLDNKIKVLDYIKTP